MKVKLLESLHKRWISQVPLEQSFCFFRIAISYRLSIRPHKPLDFRIKVARLRLPARPVCLKRQRQFCRRVKRRLIDPATLRLLLALRWRDATEPLAYRKRGLILLRPFRL
ncbi:MAG: hypothetical protein M3361_06320 [Candidatus Tectomicrobia bacterium]|nr:hypothetical protein [Candidatus Tectomicrobia bacterium]